MIGAVRQRRLINASGTPTGIASKGRQALGRGEVTGKIRFLLFGGSSRRRQQIPKIDAENIGNVPQSFVGDTFTAPLDADHHVPAKPRLESQGLLGELTLESEFADARSDLLAALLPSLLVFKKRLRRSRRHIQWHLNATSMSAPLVRHEIHITIQ